MVSRFRLIRRRSGEAGAIAHGPTLWSGQGRTWASGAVQGDRPTKISPACVPLPHGRGSECEGTEPRGTSAL